MIGLRPPVVTNSNRQWALDQCPTWAVRGDASVAEAKSRTKREEGPAIWDVFVAEQAEAFETFFAHERKAAADWSRMWRNWWSKADPKKRFPKASAPVRAPHPFWRRGAPEFARALGVATRSERMIFERIGVAQFRPDDPRLAKVRIASASPAIPNQTEAVQ